jgi:hypothetical protein
MRDFGYVFGLLAVADGEEVARWGNVKAMKWDGLYRYLLLDPQTRTHTISTLEGQPMPQTHAQGGMHCLLLAPEPGVLLALFEQKGLGPIEYRREAVSIWEKVAVRWSDASRAGEA